MIVDSVMLQGYGEDESDAVVALEELFDFEMDPLADVGDLIQWESKQGDSVAFWTGVVRQRAFHLKQRGSTVTVTATLYVQLTDENGDTE